MLTGRPGRTLVVLFVALAVVAGCGRRRQTSRSGPARQLTKGEMTVAEQKYGIAPVLDPSVTYQPNVVVVGGGADAVRSLSSTGLTWAIDAHAAHADELAAGKVIFLTNRAVGRVLDVRNDGGTLAVTLGPVAITELIRDCDIRIDAMPIDFGEAIEYAAADLPGRVLATAPSTAEVRPRSGNDAHVTRVALTTQPGAAPGAQSTAVPDVSNLVNFKVVPTAGAGGVGLRATSNGGGLTVSLEALVHINKPTLTPVLKIVDGDLREATLTLTGAAGLTLKFDAGTDVGLKANVNGRLQASPDFSLPIGGGPVPLALTIRQQLLISTALGVRNSTLSATGDYTFGGAFRIGYDGHEWALAGPGGFTAKQTVMQTANGISMAASGLNLTHQMKVVFGVGAFGLATGPYFNFNSAVGLFKGSDLGMVQCKEATLVVGMSGGIGYLIPRPVTDAINFILGSLHIRYRVESEGGVSSKPTNIINSTSTLPGCHAGKE